MEIDERFPEGKHFFTNEVIAKVEIKLNLQSPINKVRVWPES